MQLCLLCLQVSKHSQHRFPQCPLAFEIGNLWQVPYADVARMKGAAKEASIQDPVYGPRKIRVKAQTPKSAAIHARTERVRAPWQGYEIRLEKSEAASKDKAQRMIVSIE